jgi:hypothetical protein
MERERRIADRVADVRNSFRGGRRQLRRRSV